MSAAAPAPRFMTVVGHPKTIALAYTTGKPTRSRITNQLQMMYTLTSGERAWFDMSVADEIEALHLAPGEPFTICHLGGPRWSVARAQAARPSSPPPPARPAPPARPQEPPPYTPPAAAVNGQGEGAEAILARCYLQAITVTVAALEAARQKGITILPTHEGLQAAAATLFIAETRR